MGRKPKAGGAEGKRTDPEQSARFLEAAREAGVDETGKAFERAFDTISQADHGRARAERRRSGGKARPKHAK